MNRQIPPNPYKREFATGAPERQERYRQRVARLAAAEAAHNVLNRFEELEEEVNCLRQEDNNINDRLVALGNQAGDRDPEPIEPENVFQLAPEPIAVPLVGIEEQPELLVPPQTPL